MYIVWKTIREALKTDTDKSHKRRGVKSLVSRRLKAFNVSYVRETKIAFIKHKNFVRWNVIISINTSAT